MANYQNRNFGWGYNVLDAEHQIGDPYAVIAKNVTVGSGFVEQRGGYELWNGWGSDNSRTGGIGMMTPAYFRDGKMQLVFANDDDYFYLDNTDTPTDAWNTIGDMGTAVPNPYAYMHKNYIIFGTGLAANTPKKWDGSTFSNITTPADASSDIRFYEYHQGSNFASLFGGGNRRDNATNNRDSLYHTPDSDDWSTGGMIPIGDGDGQTLTGIASHSNIIAFKDSSKYRLDVVYESNSGVNVIRVLERYTDSGAVNHECIVKALNDIVALSGRKGDGMRGFSQVQTNLGGSESRKYSTKVTPLFDQINRTHANERLRSIVYDEKILMAAPFGGSTTNNVIFVGHLNQLTDLGEPAWTIFDINAGSFAILRDGNDEEMLLIGDSNSPKIYKWNQNLLTDNGFPITSNWRGKKLDMGDIGIDEFETVIIAGEMTTQTELLAKVIVDGSETTYRITQDQILGTGSLVWSHIVGSEVVGGGSSGSGFSKRRFVALLSIPDELREGSEVQIDLSASGKGYWWKMDYLGILESDQRTFNLNLFPENHWVDIQ